MSSLLLTLALASGVMLSGCAQTERTAAGVEGDVVNGQVEQPEAAAAREAGDGEAPGDPDDAAQGAPVQASMRGVRVCVINERTTRDGKPALIHVKFTKADRVSKESAYVAPGDQICGEGAYKANLLADDLIAEINTLYDSSPKAVLRAKNNLVKPPALSLNLLTGLLGLYCIVEDTTTTKLIDDKINRFTLQRLADSSSFKEFSVTVSDGTAFKTCPMIAG